jgi:ComF family protein
VIHFAAPVLPLKHAMHAVLDFCYPARCASCEGDCEGSGAVLCSECNTHLAELAAAHACEKCANPLASEDAPCPYCLGKGVAPYEKIVRLGIFDDPIKHLIHQLKYHRRWPLGEMLADRLFETERAKGLLTETDILVPVPLHYRRHIARGYNQAEILARRLGWRAHVPVVCAARRIRDTETQTNIHSNAKRFDNVRGAFALRRSAKQLRGKHVVVVDDVTTTAATLKAVAHLLKQADPASLCAMTIAIADPRRRGFEAI